METKIVLSHQMTQRFMEMQDDRAAVEQTLRIALSHHENGLNSLHKTSVLLWSELYELYPTLDQSKKYDAVYDHTERRYIVREVITGDR